MGIHKGRLLLVFGVFAILCTTATLAYWYFVPDRREAAVLQASVQEMLKSDEYDAALIEIEKLIRTQPDAGYPYLLKAQAILAGRRPTELPPSDPMAISAIRSLVQAVARDPNLVEPRRLLINYFLGTGQLVDAAGHAKKILEQEPRDATALYALAASLVTERPQEAAPYVELLLEQESPPRPRTLWLAAQIGDSVRAHSAMTDRALEWLTAHGEDKVDELLDRLALVEMRSWHARRSNDSAILETQMHAAMAELKSLAQGLSSSQLSPRLILRTAMQLFPPPSRRSSEFESLYATLDQELDALIDEIFRMAADAKVLDPDLYFGQASRLRAKGKTQAAVELLEEAIAVAVTAGGETRQMFAQCDLWLADYYLDEGNGDLAQPYIDVLLASEPLRPMGELLTGYRQMQQGDYDQAYQNLKRALPKLENHGAAHALFGLCQLRRGMITEGRQHLETGIRLGAQDPRYKARLALALAEGGYHEQAITVAKEILESPAHSAIGRALLGQLRLQSGDFDAASKDLAAAYESADAKSRPWIRLAQAELALVRGETEAALRLLDELKGTSLAAQAFALHYRHLRRIGDALAADQLLQTARQKYPESTLLLAVYTQRLIELERFAEAQTLLEEARQRDPRALAPILLLTEVLEQAGQPDRAVELLKSTSSEMPEEMSLRIRLIEKLLGARSFEEAGRLLDEVKNDGSVNPTTVDYLMARLAALQGDMETAQQYIERAAARDPDNPTLKFLMGQLAAKRGDFSTASTLFEQSLAGGGYRQQSVQALFESLLRLGDTTKAVEVLGQAEKRGQQVRSLRAQLLRLLARQEDWGTLENEVQAILQTDASEDDFLLVISAFRYVHQPKMAEKYLEKAIDQFPQSDALKEQETSLLLELGKYEDAEGRLKELLAKQPSNAMLHVLKIYLLDKTNRPEQKRQAILEGWTQCPGHPAMAALQVQSLLRDEKIDEAMAFATKAKEKYPQLPDPRYLVARMHESIGNNDKALALFNVLVAENPSDQRAAEHYFRMLVKTGLPQENQPVMEKLVSTHPDNGILIGAWAEYLALQGDLDGSGRMIAKLEGLETKGAMTDYAKAVLAFARRDLKEAERLARVSMADPRGHIPSTFLLARIRAAEGRFREAIDLVGRVCRQQHRNPTAHVFHARLLTEAGDLARAEEVCREFLKVESGDRAIRLLLAKTLLARGGIGRSKEAAQIAWDVYQEGVRGPEELEAVMNILFTGGESQRCRQMIAELESKGGSPDHLLAAGRSSFISGDYSTAARLADQVLVVQPDNVRALLLAADTQSRVAVLSEDETHYENAVRLYERILEKEPENPAAANNLAWTMGVSLGKEHRALERLLTLVPAAAKPSPTVPTDILDTVGTLYLRQKRYDEARAYFESILQREPSNAIACYRLGQIEEFNGRTDRAEQNYARARTISPTENWEARKIEGGSAN